MADDIAGIHKNMFSMDESMTTMSSNMDSMCGNMSNMDISMATMNQTMQAMTGHVSMMDLGMHNMNYSVHEMDYICVDARPHGIGGATDNRYQARIQRGKTLLG